MRLKLAGLHLSDFTAKTKRSEVLANEDRQGEIIFKPTTLLALIN